MRHCEYWSFSVRTSFTSLSAARRKNRRVQLVMPVRKPSVNRMHTPLRSHRAALPGSPLRSCLTMAHLCLPTKVTKTVHPLSAAKFRRLQSPRTACAPVPDGSEFLRDEDRQRLPLVEARFGVSICRDVKIGYPWGHEMIMRKTRILPGAVLARAGLIR